MTVKEQGSVGVVAPHTNGSSTTTTTSVQRLPSQFDTITPEYQELIQRFRDEVYRRAQENPRLAASDWPLKRMRESDYFVMRFLRRKRYNVDRAVKQFVNAVEMYEEYNCAKFNLSHFPLENFIMNAVFQHKEGLLGHPVIYVRVKYFLPCLVDYLVKFIGVYVRDIEPKYESQTFLLVLDCQGIGFVNIPYEPRAISTGIKAYNILPMGIHRILLHEAGRAMSMFYSAIKAIIPVGILGRIEFTNKNSIQKYIAKENLPDFMGGTSPGPYCQVPEDCFSVEESLRHLGLEDWAVQKGIRLTKKWYQEEIERRQVNEKDAQQ